MHDSAVTHPDLLLARRAAAADPRAWDEIVGRYGERIYNLALRFAGNRGEAEELTQDVFLKLYRNLDRYRGEMPLLAWALRLSRNLCIDHYRRHRARYHAETVSDEVLRHLPSNDDPQARSQNRQQLEIVQRALGEMSEHLAEILLLRDLQGMNYEEIAAYLELPTGTVKSRLNRARGELASRLAARLDRSPGDAALQQVSPC